MKKLYWLNTVIRNLKNNIKGIYHGLTKKEIVIFSIFLKHIFIKKTYNFKGDDMKKLVPFILLFALCSLTFKPVMSATSYKL